MPRFSEKVIEHAQDPCNRGRMEHADRVGLVGVPGRGPFFALYLRIERDCIRDVRFECNSCGATIACGSMLTELIKGKSLDDCHALTLAELVRLLDGLPADKAHCVQRAWMALGQAIGHSAR